jgi:26S proteasome regulatory subunit N3
VLRQLPKTRRFVDEEVLLSVISQFHFERRDAVFGLLGLTAKKVDTKAPCVEVEVYLTLISAIYLLDKERLEQSREILDNLFVRAGNNLGQRRSMDPLNAKIYFYHRFENHLRGEINVSSRVYELLKVLDQARTVYMKRLRTVTLHAEYESESVLLNLLLRNYLHYNLYEQAEKLISKSTFPEQGNALIFHSKLIIFSFSQ